MTSQQIDMSVPGDDTRGINDNSIVVNASANGDKRKMTVIPSRAACDILSDMVDNIRENMSDIGGEFAFSEKTRWRPSHHIQYHTLQRRDMDEDASFATLGSGSGAGNNNRRISQRYSLSNMERHLEQSPVFHPTKNLIHCRIVMTN